MNRNSTHGRETKLARIIDSAVDLVVLMAILYGMAYGFVITLVEHGWK